MVYKYFLFRILEIWFLVVGLLALTNLLTEMIEWYIADN